MSVLVPVPVPVLVPAAVVVMGRGGAGKEEGGALDAKVVAWRDGRRGEGWRGARGASVSVSVSGGTGWRLGLGGLTLPICEQHPVLLLLVYSRLQALLEHAGEPENRRDPEMGGDGGVGWRNGAVVDRAVARWQTWP